MEIGVDQDSKKLLRKYASILLILTGLFAFRVIAQLVQYMSPVNFLPPYEIWHSGALPYGWLVVTQGVILVLCLRIAWNVNNGAIMPSAHKGKILLWLGIVYLVIMCVRLIFGVIILPDHYWFGAILPTIFHLLLASFLMVYGRYHSFMSQSTLSVSQRQL